MKNIHVIPTDKPSRLWVNFINGKFELDEKSNELNANHIYITSDEELKIGNWVLNIEENTIFKPSTYEIYHIKNSEAKYYEYCKKIILTTDQDLIKDGVQAIDDEFLEWFVKNPSCEYVPIITTIVSNESTYKINIGFESWRKHIIIPKEEPKQETLEQTAVEWFYQRILAKDIKEVFKQANEMEKQQINHFEELSKWIIENKRSVFEDADISIESKRKILNKLGYSSGDY